jgi:hypothetical protein
MTYAIHIKYPQLFLGRRNISEKNEADLRELKTGNMIRTKATQICLMRLSGMRAIEAFINRNASAIVLTILGKERVSGVV